jgi:sulfoxide reductase catalytic subunit YedY
MLIKKPADIRPSEITSESVYLQRRKFIAAAVAGGVIAAAGPARQAQAASPQQLPPPMKYTFDPHYSVTQKPNAWEQITHYNNFYEFGEDKTDPYQNSGAFVSHPWSVTIDGEAEKKGTFTLEDILKPHPLQERIYRFRCVEAWSMVIPWVGFQLGDLIKRFQPTSAAKYVQFTSVYRPTQMPAQRTSLLPWPYVEGLRMDEAMHPLTLMVVGLYGRELPTVDGAPLRLISPWKYGFKGGKSIVKITFTRTQPRNTWNVVDPTEYGFYANVNPNVPHPRWSQATERVIGSGFFEERKPTLMFNGYPEVASLYTGMDLHKYY